MSRRVEYVSPAGLRLDGRRPREHRRIAVVFGSLSDCDGSCVVEAGGTTVLARVSGPKEIGRNADAALADKVVVTCDVAITAFAGDRRKQAAQGAGSKHSEDIAQAVQSIVQSIVLASQYPSSHIHIRLDVLHHDGSEKATAMNAACLALVDANVAVRDSVIALTVGIIDTHVVCDLTSVELRSQCPVLTVAVRQADPSAIVYAEMNSRVSQAALDNLFADAAECSASVFKAIEGSLRSHANEALTVQQEKLRR